MLRTLLVDNGRGLVSGISGALGVDDGDEMDFDISTLPSRDMDGILSWLVEDEKAGGILIADESPRSQVATYGATGTGMQ